MSRTVKRMALGCVIITPVVVPMIIITLLILRPDLGQQAAMSFGVMLGAGWMLGIILDIRGWIDDE